MAGRPFRPKFRPRGDMGIRIEITVGAWPTPRGNNGAQTCPPIFPKGDTGSGSGIPIGRKADPPPPPSAVSPKGDMADRPFGRRGFPSAAAIGRRPTGISADGDMGGGGMFRAKSRRIKCYFGANMCPL